MTVNYILNAFQDFYAPSILTRLFFRNLAFVDFPGTQMKAARNSSTLVFVISLHRGFYVLKMQPQTLKLYHW
jgi:hypothetical protein